MDTRRLLGTEIQFYDSHKQEWLASHAGDFVVVGGSTVVGFYSDYRSAFEAGLQALGVASPFLVRQVCHQEPVYFVY